MRRLVGDRTVLVGLAVLTLAACSDGSDRAATATTTTATTTTATTTTTTATATTTTATTTTATPATTAAPATSATGPDDRCVAASAEPTTHVYAQRPDTGPERTSLDVYHPGGCDPVPVVVWVHGGGWRRGDKQGAAVGQKAQLVRDLGAALVSVNYRLSGPGSGVRWPDHGEDVAAAISWVHEAGPRHGLDPGRVSLIGHSAGAHLAAIVATDPSLLAEVDLDADDLDCVVTLDSAAFRLRGSPAERSGLVALAFGSDPDVVDDASPQVQVERRGAPDTEFLVVARGGPERLAGQGAFVDALRAGGGTAELLVVNPYDHNEVNRFLGAPAETIVTPPVTEFLRSCVRS